MKALIVIPSRYGSTRFEGKPLVEIAGKSLVRRTYEQAIKVQGDVRVIVATDDERIFDHVQTFGECMITSSLHASGTDRCLEVAESLKDTFDILINLQGDEPFILPSQIEQLIQSFSDSETDIATLMKPLNNTADLLNPNIVKVVTTSDKTALFFSRQAIPFVRDYEEREWVNRYKYYRHIGMYAFRNSILNELRNLQSSALEIAESLEQLRWLENGYKIKVSETDFVSPAIDTPADLLIVDNFLKLNPDMV